VRTGSSRPRFSGWNHGGGRHKAAGLTGFWLARCAVRLWFLLERDPLKGVVARGGEMCEFVFRKATEGDAK